MSLISKLNLSPDMAKHFETLTERSGANNASKTTREDYSMNRTSREKFSHLMVSPETLANRRLPKTDANKLSLLSAESLKEVTSSYGIGRPQTGKVQVQSGACEVIEEDFDRKKRLEQGYLEYKENAKRFVVDKHVNLIWTRPTHVKDDIDFLPTEKMLKNLDAKYKKLEPEKLVKVLLKESESKLMPNYMRDLQKMQDLKSVSKASLAAKLDTMKSEKIVQEATEQIEKISMANLEVVERIIAENKSLKEENKILKARSEDLEAEMGIQNRKNLLLSQQITKMREEQEKLKRQFSNLESLRPVYALIKSKFPNEDIKTILNRYDRLEDYTLTYSKKIDELDDVIKSQKEEKKDLQREISKRESMLKEEENTRNKLINSYRGEIELRDVALRETDQYKDNYTVIFKKILDLYNSWATHLHVFDGRNKLGIKADLQDPIEILDTLIRFTKITTQDNLQNYLKKIIVSANQLMRKFFPDHVNEKFDPDKVYERLTKYVDKLHQALRRSDPKYVTIQPDPETEEK